MFKFIDKVIENELSHLNDHVPVEFRNIETILKNKLFHFKLKDSSYHYISESEFKEFISLIPDKFYRYVSLPIVFLRRIDLGSGAYTVSGSKYNVLSVKIVLGEISTENYSEYLKKIDSSSFVLYKPHIMQFRKMFRTLSIIAFSVK